jgi:hypothetical protein
VSVPRRQKRESFENINYSIRPAKAAQRHMFVEVIGRLSRFAPLPDYQYVGFGSTFFVDFKLLHQRYGLTRMFSIERAVRKRKRFDLNVPFDCVTMLYGDSSKMLLNREIDWQRPVIVWLDYDEPFDQTKLGDCDRVLARAAHGSLLIVSFSADAGSQRGREARIRDRLGDWVPPEENSAKLDNRRVAEIALDGLTDEARQQLAAREDTKAFRQLLRFRYSDGHPMATWGGLVLDRDRDKEAGDCKFGDLGFVRYGRQTYAIEIPNLTPVERALVERHLPGDTASAKRELKGRSVPVREVDRLARVYRYSPTFVETFA